jgi:Protein of unknown function (DUF4058)
MVSPFPGMNPYLEAPALWSEVHSWIIVELARSLNASIVPKYRAAVEKAIDRYLEIREVATGDVVTVIEVLSPKNKRSGEGREQYLRKRTKLLGSQTNLVEIDLLRGGETMPMGTAVRSDYRVVVSRVEQRSMAELYPFNLRDVLPCFALPLRDGDREPVIDLNALMRVVYESAALDLAIDYGQPLVPALGAEDKAWVEAVVGSIEE